MLELGNIVDEDGNVLTSKLFLQLTFQLGKAGLRTAIDEVVLDRHELVRSDTELGAKVAQRLLVFIDDTKGEACSRKLLGVCKTNTAGTSSDDCPRLLATLGISCLQIHPRSQQVLPCAVDHTFACLHNLESANSGTPVE